MKAKLFLLANDFKFWNVITIGTDGRGTLILNDKIGIEARGMRAAMVFGSIKKNALFV